MKAIILAAGYGTRLYPLTKDKPKPLLEVAGKPMIDHIIRKIEEIKEVDEVFIVTNDKFYNHFEGWLTEFDSKKRVKIINDQTTSNEDRLGSLGDINFVIEQEDIKESILIIAGDNLFEFSLKEFVESHKKHNKSAVALYDVKNKELAMHYGIVGVNEENKMIEFEEKPSKPKSTLASTGVYIYPPHILPLLQEFVKSSFSHKSRTNNKVENEESRKPTSRFSLDKYENSDKAGNFLEWLHKKEHVYCYITEEKWLDIGTLGQLEKARGEFRS